MTNCYDGIIHKIVAHIQRRRTLLLFEGLHDGKISLELKKK